MIRNKYTQENPRINQQDRQKITFPGSANPKEISQHHTPATHTEAVHCQRVLLGYAGDGKFIHVSVCQKLWTQHVIRQSYWENKNGAVFLPHRVYCMLGDRWTRMWTICWESLHSYLSKKLNDLITANNINNWCSVTVTVKLIQIISILPIYLDKWQITVH